MDDPRAVTRRLRVVTDNPAVRNRPADTPVANAPGRSMSPAAIRMRRYRARQRGEDVPKRKPGVQATPRDAWRRRAEAAEAELARAREQLADARSVPLYVRTRRGREQGEILQLGRELLDLLNARDGGDYAPQVREGLRDLYAALDERYDQWREP